MHAGARGAARAAGARLGQVALVVGQLQQRVRGHDVPARQAPASAPAHPRPAARLRPGERGAHMGVPQRALSRRPCLLVVFW